MLRPIDDDTGRQIADSTSMPAPVGGWNARDALANMKPTEAVILDNWFPETTNCVLRKGFTSHVTGITGTVQTLAEWAGHTSRKLIAANTTAIYDVTSAGAVGAAAVSSLTNGRWQWVNYATSAGVYLYMVNGADTPYIYDGTTWTSITGVSTPAITGVTTTALINIAVHKKRLWFVEKDSLSAWWLAADSLGGAATEFDFGAVMSLGGYLMAVATWTRDGGDGLDDLLVAISSQGQVAIYQGTDPSSATDWGLVGVFRIGAPIGRRCTIKTGGDLAIITIDGVVSLAAMLGYDRTVAAKASITDKIRNKFAAMALSQSSTFGWQGIGYPRGHRVVFNIPTGGSVFHQYVMNTLTGAWCRFTGMNASCWGMLNEELYFGGSTAVYKADTGYEDNGAAIPQDLKTAFNYYGTRGALKQYIMIRPQFLSSGQPSPVVDVNVDFEDRDPQNVVSVETEAALWGTAKWDEAVWSGDTYYAPWLTVFGLGQCMAIRMKGLHKGISIELNAFDVVYEPGGII